MLGVGTAEVVLIMCIVLFVVGPRKLPQIARAIGRMARFFKDSLADLNDAIIREPPEELKKEVEDYFVSQKEGDKKKEG